MSPRLRVKSALACLVCALAHALILIYPNPENPKKYVVLFNEDWQ